ncbi:hypothetical protein ABZY68_09460 [Streptomyces sp. NPDC006482]|uniref:WXG100 family type VII secretion target n=1 Tax=Streptomyces sp. NPDC006482 TaxID=3154306 RepID=UPI0033A24258
MTHQQMLAWVDEASSYNVGAAAQRLKTVAAHLAVIADELRTSMGQMDWEGEAEKAFVEWANNVANATTGLADYSERGSVWMTENAAAISLAQSAIPRYTSHESAKANLEAAQKYRNDPDSATVAANARKAMAASEELAAIEAKEKANQQAAAAEMEKLSSAYQWSSFHMGSTEPPTFPPPPGAFVPESSADRGTSTSIGSTQRSDGYSTGTDNGTSTQTPRQQSETRPTTETNTVPPSGDPTGPTHVIRPDGRTETRPEVPVDLGIDSVDTLPAPTTGPPQTTGPTPQPVKPDGGTPPFVTTTGVPPFTTKGGGTGQLPPLGPSTGGTRGPMTTGPRGLPMGPGPLGGTREGISGGRQVPSTQGRPATGIPRSTVIGGETGGRNGSGVGRGPMGGGMGGAMGGGMGAGQNGVSGGRRLAGETGGVVGGKAQRSGAAAGGARPFTPGGSGLVRGASTPAGDRREERNGERPDYLVEDEETWQQGNRRVAPPVVD